MTHLKNEIVKKMREEFFCKYYDPERLYEKIYTNISFTELLIENYSLEKVTQAGLIFLYELKEDEFSLLDSSSYGTPRIALRVLFDKALEAKLEGEILVGLINMFQTGNRNCSFLFEILRNTNMEKSALFFQKLSEEMDKEINDSYPSSRKRDAKRDFIWKNRADILGFLDQPKQPQLFS